MLTAMRSRVAFPIAVTATACVLTIDPLPTSPSSIDGGAADGATESGPTGDGGLDAAPSDGGGGGVDATPEASAKRWCDALSTKPMFCEDFDIPPLAPAWETHIDTGASVNVNVTDSRSPPGSLLVAIADNPAQKLAGYLKFAPPSPPATVSKLHYTFDFRIDTAGSYAEIAYVRLSSGHSFYFRADTAGVRTFTAEAYLADGGIPAHDIALTVPQTLTAWTHFDVTIDLASAQRTAKVLVDGTQVASQNLESTLYAPGAASIQAGIGYAPDGTSAWAMRFDNVTLDWQ